MILLRCLAVICLNLSMEVIELVRFKSVSFCTLLVFSVVSMGSMLNRPVSPQEMQVAGSTVESTAQSTDKKNLLPPVNHPGENNTHETNSVYGVTANKDVAESSQQPVSTSRASSIALSSSDISRLNGVIALKSKVAALSAENVAFHQQTEDKLKAMQSIIMAHQAHLAGLSNTIHALQAQIGQLQGSLNQQSHAVNQISSSLLPWVVIQNHFEKYWLWYLLGLFALLSLLAIWLFGAEKSTETVSPPSAESQQEYDFMGSPEGVSAKLDLARAYLAMQDFSQMKNVLSEVLSKGNVEQRETAQSLLKQMPEASQ